MMLAAAVAAVLFAASARGGETWDGGGSNSEWSTDANWNTVRGIERSPPNDGTADIIMAGTTKLSNQVDVDWDINSLTFNSTAGAFSINGYPGVTLGIGAGGMINNDTQLQALLLPIGLNTSQTWTAAAGPIVLASGISSHFFLPRTLALAGGFDITVAGPITDNISLSKTGAGTLFLVGPDGNNTYTGSTSVTGGTLALNRTGGTDRAIPGNLVIGDGAGTDTVRLDAAEQITSAAGKLVTVNSSGVFNLNGFNETIRDLMINGGSVTTGGGTLTVAGSLSTTGGSVTTGGGALAVAGSLSTTGGTLQLLNNANVTSGSGSIGDSAGSNGQVTVSGAGATWTNSAELYVGNAGNGTLDITAGAVVSNVNAYIGNQAGAPGEVTVDGMNSMWTSSGDVYLGNGGDATLNITGGGKLASMGAHVGYAAGSSGQVTVDGANSSWSGDGDIFIGESGMGTMTVNGGAVSFGEGSVHVGGPNGTLTITGGGSVGANGAVVGGSEGSNGRVLVDGQGSTWYGAGFTIGRSGHGTLDVINGGIADTGTANFMQTKDCTISFSPGSTGEINVDGENSILSIGGKIVVANRGDGILNVTRGGQVTNRGRADIGLGGTGTVTIDGPGSTWNVGAMGSNDLYIGDFNGTLNITGGGQVNNATVYMSPSNSGVATVTVDGFGSRWVNSEFLYVGVMAFADASLTVANGGLVEASEIIVNAAGEIHGDGNLLGNLENSGLVSPGTSAGVLSIDGDYTQTSTGDLAIELASLTSFDQFIVTGESTLTGKLTVNLLDSFVPAPGQTFTFLTADNIDGTFATEMLPSVPGLIFDVIYNPNSVVFTVFSALPGDANLDGRVSIADFLATDRGFARNLTGWANGDFNFSGSVDAADFFLMDQTFLNQGAALGPLLDSATPSSAPVPEPALATVFAALAFVATRRLHSRYMRPA